jgi:hypothetical protein
LNRRVHAIRRSLLFGGVIGTVAFSAIAGYETNAASQNPAPVPTETQSTVQPTTASFFANQASSGLTPSPAATVAKAATTTPTPATAETAGADARATRSAKASAAATETAEAIPTETPTPVEDAPSAPSDDAPAQVRSNSHSSS